MAHYFVSAAMVHCFVLVIAAGVRFVFALVVLILSSPSCRRLPVVWGFILPMIFLASCSVIAVVSCSTATASLCEVWFPNVCS